MWNLLIKSLLRSKGIGLAIFSIALIVSSIIATTSVMNSIILQNENISKLSYSNNNLSNDLPLAAIIGIQAEKILNIRIGQWIAIVSAISGNVADLKVVGIFETQSPMDSEIFVNLNIAQSIISIGKDFVNFIRVKINPLQTNEYKIYSDLGIIVESSKTNQDNLPISSISPSVINFNPNLLGISSPNDAINYYLSKYGFNFSSLIVVASILLLIMSVGIFVTSRVIISDNRKEIDLIKAIGVTEKKLLST
jgi:ABC-type transport system, involved in lipoprotein release, permease component